MPNEGRPQDGLPYYQDELYIPEHEFLPTEIAQDCHDYLVAGHYGQEKTIEIVTRNFDWKGHGLWIRVFIRSCDECQHSRSPGHPKYVLLQTVEVPYAAWSWILTELITQLLESQGKTQIIVELDRFTKMAHCTGLHKNATAKDVADPCLREVGTLHRLPTEKKRFIGH